METEPVGGAACSLLVLLKRTTAAFNKHVIRRKTAGRSITDGGVPGISEEETTRADGSLFQHLVMHIAQNFIPAPNNQRKQYRCYEFPGSFAANAGRAGGISRRLRCPSDVRPGPCSGATEPLLSLLHLRDALKMAERVVGGEGD